MNNRSIFQSILISLFFAIPVSVANIFLLVANHTADISNVYYVKSYVISLVGLLLATLALTFATARVEQDEEIGEVDEVDEDSDVDDGKELGTVKWFDGSKGYGFIQRENGEDVFVHFRSIRGRGRRFLVEGQQVKFRISKGDKGPQAEDVVRVRNKKAA